MAKSKITIKEIARRSGYGVGTVSRALSDTPHLVKEETLKKILETAGKYGYVKNSNAQALVSGRTTDIGFVIPAIFGSPFYNDFSIKLISSILSAVSDYGYKLRVLFLKEKAGFHEITREIRSLNLKGLIICPYSQTFYIAESDIKKLGIPVVVLSKHVKGDNIHSVILDDYKGGYDGTDFLLGLGHRRIAILRGFRKDIEQRYMGYLDAHRDKGVPVDKNLVLKGDGMERSGYEKTLKLLEK
nr:LacI family DNA-binding transcriptional regulator [Candidatus Omnitrophota bacterium]